MVTDITSAQVVEGLGSLIEEAKTELGINIDAEINEDTRPLLILKSDVLVTLISRLEDLLNIDIPDNCYPFLDKENHKPLTLKEVAQIILNKATNDR